MTSKPHKFGFVLLIASLVLPVGNIQAAIGISSIGLDAGDLAANISSSDLANAGSVTLLSVSSTPFANISSINNGGGGATALISEELSEYAATIIFNFDTSVNTLGYSISAVTAITGVGDSINPQWPDATEPAYQLYNLSYRLVGEAVFHDLVTVSQAPDNTYQKVTLVGLAGEIGGGVDAVRFTWNDPFPAMAPGFYPDESYTAIVEIDVFGSAIQVPEPGALSMLALMFAGMVVRRTR